MIANARQSWRNDATGRRCLTDYRDACLEWCEPSIEPDGRFMNQGYLTRWPEQYQGVHVIRHPGVNLAYWNLADCELRERPLRVNGESLIFYHYSGANLDRLGIWRTPRREFGPNLSIAVTAIYRPFLREVERLDRQLRRRHRALIPMQTGWQPGGKPVRRGPWPRDRKLRGERARWDLDPATLAERQEV